MLVRCRSRELWSMSAIVSFTEVTTNPHEFSSIDNDRLKAAPTKWRRDPKNAQRDKESPGRAGAFKESFKPPKDQGALDTPILFQRTNQARRGSLNPPTRRGSLTTGQGLPRRRPQEAP